MKEKDILSQLKSVKETLECVKKSKLYKEIKTPLNSALRSLSRIISGFEKYIDERLREPMPGLLPRIRTKSIKAVPDEFFRKYKIKK